MSPNFLNVILALLLAHVVLAQVPDLGPQLSQVIQYQVSQYTECTDFIATCQPYTASCASIVCQQCTGLGATPLDACCAGSNPTSCFSSLDAAVGGTPIITAAPTNIPDPNGQACVTVADFISFCESVTPNFDNLDATVQASCLCYSSTVWQPTVFDGLVNSCVAFASTADTSDLMDIESVAGFCSAAGNVESAPADTGAPVATTARQTKAGLSKTPVSTSTPTLGNAPVPVATSTPTLVNAPVPTSDLKSGGVSMQGVLYSSVGGLALLGAALMVPGVINALL